MFVGVNLLDKVYIPFPRDHGTLELELLLFLDFTSEFDGGTF